MSSPGRILSGAVIYPFLVAGALITLAPFALGLLTSFTSAGSSTPSRRCRFRRRRRWRITRA